MNRKRNSLQKVQGYQVLYSHWYAVVWRRHWVRIPVPEPVRELFFLILPKYRGDLLVPWKLLICSDSEFLKVLSVYYSVALGLFEFKRLLQTKICCFITIC